MVFSQSKKTEFVYFFHPLPYKKNNFQILQQFVMKLNTKSQMIIQEIQNMMKQTVLMITFVMTLKIQTSLWIGKDPDGTGFLIQLGLKCQKNLCLGTIVVPNLEVGPLHWFLKWNAVKEFLFQFKIQQPKNLHIIKI